MGYFSKYETAISSYLGASEFTTSTEESIDSEGGLEMWYNFASDLKAADQTLYFIGNGASATMSSHMAVDFTKNGGIKSLAFNDSAFLTAISNDISNDAVFSLCIEKFATPGDLLVAISSSANSQNIVNGVNAANESGMRTVTLTGMKPDNHVRKLGDLNVYLPAETYGIVECCHQILLHCWLDRFMEIEPK